LLFSTPLIDVDILKEAIFYMYCRHTHWPEVENDPPSGDTRVNPNEQKIKALHVHIDDSTCLLPNLWKLTLFGPLKDEKHQKMQACQNA